MFALMAVSPLGVLDLYSPVTVTVTVTESRNFTYLGMIFLDLDLRERYFPDGRIYYTVTVTVTGGRGQASLCRLW